LKVRPYTKDDKQQVLALFSLNTPKYFDSAEETDLIHYLENELEDYFVAEEGESIVGAGGLNYFPKENTARISWDFVHPDFHGQGIGQALVRHRLHHLKRLNWVKKVVVRTSQFAYRFYEKMGFELKETKKDYWAPGFDLYLMSQPNHPD